jgi:VWFA-related protein
MSRVTTVVCTIVVAALSLVLRAQQTQEQKPDPQRPPTFRTGAHYVAVDAYPTQDGKPITGLAAEDFELLEDGKPQVIDRVEFINHPEWTPLAERRDPNSQREGFEMAADPKYRVFVLYLDAWHVDFAGGHRVALPIIDLLNRMMGPQDLFGVMTPYLTIKDLLLGQSTLSIQEQLEKYPYWGIASKNPLPEELELETAGYGFAVPIKRLDKVYTDLEALVDRLGVLRDERKNIIFFSDALPSPRPSFKAIASDGDMRKGAPPEIGTGSNGKLTMGSREAHEANEMATRAEKDRLISIDFDQRFKDLLRAARQANVSFYTVRPGGLDAGSSLMLEGTSNLVTLAEQTDGISLTASNDLRTGMAKISADLSSHYVLGYYTNNTRWDGGSRRLTVKLKSTGKAIRARREFRAPTEAEMAGIRNARSATPAAAPSAGQTALSALARVSPSSRVNAYGTILGSDVAVVAEIAAAEIEGGRFKQGASVEILLTPKDGQPVTLTGKIDPLMRGTLVRSPAGDSKGPWQAVVRMRGDDNLADSDTVSIEADTGTLLGKPIAYRAASAAASAYRPIAAFQFRRTERVRIEWPALQTIESHQARLLDRTGKPIAIPLTTTNRDNGSTPMVATDLSLAPLSNGDYLIEVSAKSGEKSQTEVVAIRVSMAR